jgi:UDP-galactopyranose mutase
MSDSDLINLAKIELDKIGLAKYEDIIDGAVVKMKKTYPVYDDSYESAMPMIKEAFSKFTNLYPVGRNGMHRYNNQDHSMYTSMLAVENLIDGKKHDLWQVNVERVYHEEIKG